jgi:hypothetical protein
LRFGAFSLGRTGPTERRESKGPRERGNELARVHRR